MTRTALTAERFLLPVIRQQQAMGHTVELACTDGPVRSAGDLRCHRYRLRRSAAPGVIAAAVKDLRAILRAGRYDVVVAHMNLPGIVGRLAFATTATKAALLYASHGMPFYPAQDRSTRLACILLEKALSRWNDGLIVLNHHDHAAAHRFGLAPPDRIWWLRTVGIHYDLIRQAAQDTDRRGYRRSLGLDPAKPLVLYAARFARHKGALLFVQIAMDLLAGSQQVCLAMAGTGPLARRIGRTLQDRGLSGQIRLLGWREDMPSLLAASDVLCLPTFYEGSPVVLQEAMAAGCAVVASDVPGPADLITDGHTGLLVRPGDVQGFTRAVCRLIADPGLRARITRAAAEQARCFHVGIWAPRWAQVIEAVGQGRSRLPSLKA